MKNFDQKPFIHLNKIEGRTFILGDAHGCYDKVCVFLDSVKFSSSDRVIFTGDLIDRGKHSFKMLELVLKNDNIYSVMGNHEYFILTDDYHNHLANGGEWFYDWRISDVERDCWREFIKSFPFGIEFTSRYNKKIGVVHAEPPHDWNLMKAALLENDLKSEAANNLIVSIIWSRKKYKSKNATMIENIDQVYVGHTETDSGEIETLGNTNYIDVRLYKSKLNTYSDYIEL